MHLRQRDKIQTVLRTEGRQDIAGPAYWRSLSRWRDYSGGDICLKQQQPATGGAGECARSSNSCGHQPGGRRSRRTTAGRSSSSRKGLECRTRPLARCARFARSRWSRGPTRCGATRGSAAIYARSATSGSRPRGQGVVDRAWSLARCGKVSQ